MNHVEPSPDLIAQTHDRLRPVLSPTPLVQCPRLDGLVSRRHLLKLESMQPTGSFKVRGAFSKLLALTDRPSVITASSGNHGAAVAFAAHTLELRATVVVPDAAAQTKVDLIGRYGADVISFGSI